MCKYLNESVPPAEQVQALNMNVDLYNRIVAIQKTNLEGESTAGRLVAMVFPKKNFQPP